jgi:hypothetical protein
VLPSIYFKTIRFAPLGFESESLALEEFVAHIIRAVTDFTCCVNKSIKFLLYSKKWLTMLVLNCVRKQFTKQTDIPIAYFNSAFPLHRDKVSQIAITQIFPPRGHQIRSLQLQ